MALGRPREFDMNHALDQALNVFWRNGYEGTSIADLTRVMGINPPSLYAAFGNKEALFRKTLDHYAARRTRFWQQAAEAPTARDMVETVLYGTVNFVCDNPAGCLLIRGVMTCGEAADALAQDLAARRAEGAMFLRERLERARAEGEIRPDFDIADYASYIMTVLEGMSVRAAGGAGRDELKSVAAMALRTWPE